MMHRVPKFCATSFAALGLLASATAQAQGSSEDLAKQLANPVAALISVPLQLNYDQDMGAARKGDRWLLNVQPVVPIDISTDWNLISRTIVPLTRVDSGLPGSDSQYGVGDIVQSFFFSPKKPTDSGWIWGAGPVLLVPTGSDVSAKKWGAGPTGVALRQMGPWTIGLLANHIWSYAGDSQRPDVSASFVQPFVSYTTPTAWSFGVNTESTYDWKGKQWSVPLNFTATKVVKFGDQLVNIGGGLRYWADGPESGPHGWGARLIVAFLFPK